MNKLNEESTVITSDNEITTIADLVSIFNSYAEKPRLLTASGEYIEIKGVEKHEAVESIVILDTNVEDAEGMTKRLMCSSDTSIKTYNRGNVNAGDLTIDDELLGDGSASFQLLRVIPFDSPMTLYSVVTKEPGMIFFVNGFGVVS